MTTNYAEVVGYKYSPLYYGLVHAADHHGNIIVAGDGTIGNISAILNDNETALLKLHEQTSVKLMDIGFYQFMDEIDYLFDFINGNRLDVLGDGLFSGETGVDDLIAMLQSLVDNIKKLQLAASNSLSGMLSSGSDTASKMKESVDEMERMYNKYTNLLMLIEQKLARLQTLNTNLTKLEVSTIAASELAKLYGEYLKLNANIKDLEHDVNNQDQITQRGIDRACKQLAGIEAILADLNEANDRMRGVKGTVANATVLLQEISDRRDEMDKSLGAAGDACQALDEYVKCLVIYAASIVEAGDNIKIRKEGKVFRLDAVLPDPPPCPEIVFINPDARPTTTKPPRPVRPPVVPPDVTPVPPVAGCKAASVTLGATGGNNWLFDTDKIDGKTVGNPKTPEIVLSNPNAYTITVEVTMDVIVRNYSDYHIHIRKNKTERLYAIACSSNASFINWTVDFKMKDGLNRSGESFQGTFTLDVQPGETASLDLYLWNTYPREAQGALKSVTLKTYPSDGKSKGAKPGASLGDPAPAGCTPQTQTIGGTGTLPDKPWKAVEQPLKAYWQDDSTDQGMASMPPRPEGKTVWDANSWSTKKSPTKELFVYQHGVRRRDDKSSHYVFTYNNYDFDVPGGDPEYYLNIGRAAIQQWLDNDYSYEWEAFETYNWSQAAQHFYSWDGGHYYANW